jgi:hypothetical protein
MPFLAWMTAFEERMLSDGLAGYADYAARARYCLIPGIWETFANVITTICEGLC